MENFQVQNDLKRKFFVVLIMLSVFFVSDAFCHDGAPGHTHTGCPVLSEIPTARHWNDILENKHHYPECDFTKLPPRITVPEGPIPLPEGYSPPAPPPSTNFRRCGVGWSPQSQYQHHGESPKVMIYALEFEWDPDRNGGYSCKTIEIRTGDDAIENLAGWKLYLGTSYNPSHIPKAIPEAHSQITDRILRITPEMLGLETFPCNTVNDLSHPLPGVDYSLKTDKNVLVDTAYSCFLWGQNAWTMVNGINVKSPRRISSAGLRAMEVPRLERYIRNNMGVFTPYMDIEGFTWDRVVLSDWLLPASEERVVGTPNAPSLRRRNLVTTWGALKK